MQQRPFPGHRNWIVVAGALALLAGCGDSMPFDVAPVSDKITYADGTPIDADMVTAFFIPQDTAPRRGNGGSGARVTARK